MIWPGWILITYLSLLIICYYLYLSGYYSYLFKVGLGELNMLEVTLLGCLTIQFMLIGLCKSYVRFKETLLWKSNLNGFRSSTMVNPLITPPVLG